MTTKSITFAFVSILAAIILLSIGVVIGSHNQQPAIQPVDTPSASRPNMPVASPSVPSRQYQPVQPNASIPRPTVESGPTTANVPQQVLDHAKANGYRIIEAFEGNATKTTGSFTATQSEWWISWDTEPSSEGDSNFIIFVYDSNGNMVETAANVIGKSSDMTVMHQPGTFYLDITSGQPYRIICFEKP